LNRLEFVISFYKVKDDVKVQNENTLMISKVLKSKLKIQGPLYLRKNNKKKRNSFQMTKTKRYSKCKKEK